MKRSIVCAAFLLGAACGEDVQRNSLVDRGKLCVGGGEPVGELDMLGGVCGKIQPGQMLSFTVSLDRECLSSSCDTERVANCDAELEDDQILVTSKLEWTSHGGECTAGCQQLAAQCKSPPLEAGNYTGRFGGSTVRALTVPSDLGKGCHN